MTPEERNRTIDFIIASQARLAAAQERDREDRLEFQQWSKGLTEHVVRLADRQTQLMDWQSQRMDRLDKLHEDLLARIDDFQRQTLHLLNLILDRLPPLPERRTN